MGNLWNPRGCVSKRTFTALVMLLSAMAICTWAGKRQVLLCIQGTPDFHSESTGKPSTQWVYVQWNLWLSRPNRDYAMLRWDIFQWPICWETVLIVMKHQLATYGCFTSESGQWSSNCIDQRKKQLLRTRTLCRWRHLAIWVHDLCPAVRIEELFRIKYSIFDNLKLKMSESSANYDGWWNLIEDG